MNVIILLFCVGGTLNQILYAELPGEINYFPCKMNVFSRVRNNNFAIAINNNEV